MKKESELILWFNEINMNSLPKVGGKAASLGEMFNIKLPIPNGFCITADAYSYFLEETNIKTKIAKLLKDIDVEDTSELEEIADKIQELIIKQEIPYRIKTAITEAYDLMNVSPELIKQNHSALSYIKAGRDSPYVAVRSSATAEDLPSISKDEHILIKIDNKTYFRKMEEIYDLIGEGKDFNIEIPAMKDNKIQWTRVESLYKHKVKEGEKLYRIITETGREIVVSPNHTLIILDEDNLETKNVKSIHHLKGNERLPAINKLPILNLNQKEIDVLEYISGEDIVNDNGSLMIKNNSNNWRIQSRLPRKLEITRDFAYFLGLYCAEGSTYKNNEIIITNSDEKIMNRIINFALSLNLYHNQKINKHSLRIYNKAFTRFLNNVAGIPDKSVKGKGKICRNKKVPEFIFGWNEELIGEFLKGCFDGDGCCEKELISYCSTSKMLTSGIIKLLEMLEIEWHLREKKNPKALNINIRSASFERFSRSIGFESEIKDKRLNNLIKKFNERRNHPEFLNNIEISNSLSNKLREKIELGLPKQTIMINFCHKCNNKLTRTSYYKGKERFCCEKCHKMFYEKETIKKEIENYIYYDNKGRFLKNTIPWNKGHLSKNHGIKNFKKILEKNNINFDILNDFIKWDQIKEIQEVEYNDYVYDFSVPEVQNFAAGIGGIITHNSASFAGQQATFLNVKGNKNVLESVKKCWASLFTARAIYYRNKNNFDHMKVYLCAIVHKMINGDVSGVMFTANPATNDESEIMIEGSYGIGESVVSGEVNPDNFIVDKETLEIKSFKINKKDFMLTRDEQSGGNKKIILDDTKANSQCLEEFRVKELAKYGKIIEAHYKKPMDIEWGIERNKLYILQARPITTLKKERKETQKLKGDVILEGLNASPGVASGPVRIIKNVSEINKVQEGDILVTKMTDPDYVVAMKKATAIVTDEGGITSHAAIVSRELGIPAVVGTEKATQILKENEIITVDGNNGKIYHGDLGIKTARIEEWHGEKLKTKTKIYMNLGEPELAEKYKHLPFDGIGLMRLEFLITSYIGKHPSYMIKIGKQNEYIEKLAEGISRTAKAIYPRPIIVRFTDFKTNEYRNLEGGAEYEEQEDNPMIGWRGVSRYISPEYVEAFRLELKAIKKVRESLDNVHVMLPFVRTVNEVRKVLGIMATEGLVRSDDFKIYLMAEVPSMALIPEDFAKLDIDGMSLGSNDMTQLVLGVDRDSGRLGKLGYFDERNKAVLKAISNVIKAFNEHGKLTGICGQSVSNYLEIVEFLLNHKISSVSVNPDRVVETMKIIHEQENKNHNN